jgi:hypothetical protein
MAFDPVERDSGKSCMMNYRKLASIHPKPTHKYGCVPPRKVMPMNRSQYMGTIMPWQLRIVKRCSTLRDECGFKLKGEGPLT